MPPELTDISSILTKQNRLISPCSRSDLLGDLMAVVVSNSCKMDLPGLNGQYQYHFCHHQWPASVQGTDLLLYTKRVDGFKRACSGGFNQRVWTFSFHFVLVPHLGLTPTCYGCAPHVPSAHLEPCTTHYWNCTRKYISSMMTDSYPKPSRTGIATDRKYQQFTVLLLWSAQPFFLVSSGTTEWKKLNCRVVFNNWWRVSKTPYSSNLIGVDDFLKSSPLTELPEDLTLFRVTRFSEGRSSLVGGTRTWHGLTAKDPQAPLNLAVHLCTGTNVGHQSPFVSTTGM